MKKRNHPSLTGCLTLPWGYGSGPTLYFFLLWSRAASKWMWSCPLSAGVCEQSSHLIALHCRRLLSLLYRIQRFILWKLGTWLDSAGTRQTKNSKTAYQKVWNPSLLFLWNKKEEGAVSDSRCRSFFPAGFINAMELQNLKNWPWKEIFIQIRIF